MRWLVWRLHKVWTVRFYARYWSRMPESAAKERQRRFIEDWLTGA